MTMVDLQPDDLEVLQAETGEPGPAAHVVVDGPVRTQDLPHKAAAAFSKTIGTTPVRILRADHRRATAQVMSIGGNMWFAFSESAAAGTGTSAQWPQNTTMTLTADVDLWVYAVSGTTLVSVKVEQWATGE